jgi:hypothetical protein
MTSTPSGCGCRSAIPLPSRRCWQGAAVERLKRFATGVDVFSKQSDGSTVAEQYARQGIVLRVANTDRVNCWEAATIMGAERADDKRLDTGKN